MHITDIHSGIIFSTKDAAYLTHKFMLVEYDVKNFKANFTGVTPLNWKS